MALPKNQVLILDHFWWENGHNSIKQSWITIKNATFDISKKSLGPVHLYPKTDKWDYLRSPIMKKNFVSCSDIGEVPRSPGKWNWNRLYFLPFIFTFEQGVYQCPIGQFVGVVIGSSLQIHVNVCLCFSVVCIRVQS